MAIVLADVGADTILNAYLNNTRAVGGNDLILRLFCNNVTPIDTFTEASFTEATGGGYAEKTLTTGSWTITPANDPSDGTYAKQVFTFTGALDTNVTIYGYYIVDEDDVLQWAEVLDVPFTPANTGDHLDITPKFASSKGTPA